MTPLLALALGTRFSGPLYCRFPEDAPLKRAVLLVAAGKENGSTRLLLRGMDGKGVIADEREVKVEEVVDRDAVQNDPRYTRRKHGPQRPTRYSFTAGGEPVVSGTLDLSVDERSLTLKADRTAEVSLLGGACEGTLKRERGG